MLDFDRSDVTDIEPIGDLDEGTVTEMFGEKEARWYQIAARNATEEAIEQSARVRVLIHQPTGTGKTLTNGMILASQRIHAKLATRGVLRVLFAAHVHRLLTQAERTYASVQGIRPVSREQLATSSFCNPEYVAPEGVTTEIYYHSVFSELPQGITFDLVVIDEAHHEAMQTIQYQLDRLGNVPIVGLTATPDRADGCLIKFDTIVAPITRDQAVKEGWLAETNIHTFVDVPSKTKTKMICDILKSYHTQMGQTMIFLRTRQEARDVANYLLTLGYEGQVAPIIHQSNAEVDQILDDFSSKKLKFLVNCNKINEGVDVQGCTDVVLGRTYGSYSQLNQVIGRASRPDSECNVWELVTPLSSRNLDTTVIVGTPKKHRLISWERAKWVEREFDYVTHRSSKQLGLVEGVGHRRT